MKKYLLLVILLCSCYVATCQNVTCVKFIFIGNGNHPPKEIHISNRDVNDSCNCAQDYYSEDAIQKMNVSDSFFMYILEYLKENRQKDTTNLKPCPQRLIVYLESKGIPNFLFMQREEAHEYIEKLEREIRKNNYFFE